jgi:hypothetical protein
MSEFRMKYQIVADAAKAKAEVKSFDDLLKHSGATIGSALAGPAAIAATGIAAMGGAAATAGVALFSLTKQASDYGSTIFDASKKTGLHAEALSAMDFAAKQSGTSLEAITGGIAKFSKTVGEAADGSDKAAAKLKDFGFTPQQAINDLDGALGKVFARIQAAPPGIERMTLAQKAFGKSGADLLPFIDQFDGDLGKLIKQAKALGVTITDEDARAADEFGDQLDTLTAQIASAGRSIGRDFMPIFLDMARGVSGWLVTNKDEITRWGQQTSDELLGLIGYWNDYHKAVAGSGSHYKVNAAGERQYISDFLFSGALGVALSDRGTKQRMDNAGPAWQGNNFYLDPRTMTIAPRPPAYTGPSSLGDGSGKPEKVHTTNIGRADSQFDSWKKYDKDRKLAQEYFQNETKYFEAEARTRIQWSEYGVAAGKRTEDEFARFREDLESQVLDDRKQKLDEYFKVLAPGSDEYKQTEQEIRILEQDIETKRAQNATNEAYRKKKQIEDTKELHDKAVRSWNDQLQAIKATSDATEDASRKHAAYLRSIHEAGTVTGGAGIGGAIAHGLGVELVPVFDQTTDAMLTFQQHLALVHQDITNFTGQALGGMIDGLSQMGAAWLATGEFSVQAALRMASGAALGIAMQAGIKAIFEVAEGFAALANPFLAWTAPLHFKAAATYGIVAGIAGGAGVALGLGARAAGGGSGSGSGRSSSSASSTSGQQQQQTVNPYSRASDNAYISGHRADPQTAALIKLVTKLEKKIDAASPGDVLTRGVKQRPGLIGRQTVEDVTKNPSLGSTLLRRTGAR